MPLWSVKPRYRREVLTDDILSRCEHTMIAACDSFGATLVEFNGEHDLVHPHVHLLVHYPPKVALSTLVNSLKGVSARMPRKEFPAHIRRYLWGGHCRSPSQVSASRGRAPSSITEEYVENQRQPG
ncbi:IS605 family transposase [Nonomuraea glycinis]|uniref:IS605 family transposase n=1 Tax=Nonomuraea glycinis TaxID=2047744 RepID=A0A918A7K8_9ACTN|nr:IS605 family transposase [Nonomuraea glycinis]